MSADRRKSVEQVLRWAFAWAMVAAVIHVGFVCVKYFGFDRFTGAERDFVWMVPVGYLLAFAILSVPAAVLVILVPRAAGLRIAVGVLGFFGTLGILLLFPRIHPAASAVLAAGIGARASSWVMRSSLTAFRTGLVIAGGLTLISVAAVLERRLSERQMLGALEQARPGAPNVVLIILDTVRAANMSFLGYGRETTPELGRLAARGAVFEQAYSTAPWTLASHASFFTGRYPSQLNVDWEVPLAESEPTVAEVFRNNGYATAGFVANRIYAGWDSGLDRGFVHYDDTHITLKQIMLSTTFSQTNFARSIAYDHSTPNVIQSLKQMDLRRNWFPLNDFKPADIVAADCLRWLSANPDRPFFAFLNFFDAHRPYTSPRPRRFSANPGPADFYDAAIFHIDSVLGTLFDSLEARGTLSNTIVVITSDHGEGFGEHGLEGHGKSLYRTELHVPLLIVAPRSVAAGVRIDKPASLRDLPKTLLDLAGIADGKFPGVSLRNAWMPLGDRGSVVISEVPKRIRMEPHEPASLGSMRSVLDDSTHFILNGDNVEQLFDWRTDPGEETDIAKLPRSRPVVAAKRRQLDQVIGTR